MAALDACGFDHDHVDPRSVEWRLEELIEEVVLLLEDPLAQLRPHESRWSIHEYAAHCRDVLITIRERLIGASIADSFVSSPIYREERVAMGLYALESTDDLITSLKVAHSLLGKIIALLPDSAFSRTMDYSALYPSPVTLQWVAAQALHEMYHHSLDMKENLVLLSENHPH
jgi:hypothetical protein